MNALPSCFYAGNIEGAKEGMRTQLGLACFQVTLTDSDVERNRTTLTITDKS